MYSYPPNNNILSTDILVCTSATLVGGKPKNQTKSISIQNLTSYVNTSSTNNLDQVLSNGNYSLLFANVGQLGLFDTSENDYALLKISDSEFIFEDVNGIATSQSRRGITLLGDGVHYGSIYLPPYVTSHQYNLPDNTGTIALTSNLSAYVPYTGATQAVNLGAFNLTVNGVTVGRGNQNINGNTAVGVEALYNAASNNNTALGFWAGQNLITGTQNIFLGVSAGRRFGTASPLTIGSNLIMIGNGTQPLNNNQNNQIVIGTLAIGAGSNTVTIGNTAITTTRLRGTVQGGSFVKDSGIASQYLMADGSVTTAPYKYNFGGILPLTGTLTTTNLLTITIPANSLTDYLDIRSIMVQQSGTILGGMTVMVWHNSVNNFSTATRIANYAFGAGGTDLFAQITRRFSLQSGLLFGFPALGSNIVGEGSTSNAALSTPFDPAAINYLFVSIQLNNATDTATLRNVNITT